MLDPTEKAVTLIEECDVVGSGDTQLGCSAQCRRGGGRAQRGMRVSVHELEVLRGKLDIDDAAVSHLEIARCPELLLHAIAHAGDLLGDLRVR